MRLVLTQQMPRRIRLVPHASPQMIRSRLAGAVRVHVFGTVHYCLCCSLLSRRCKRLWQVCFFIPGFGCRSTRVKCCRDDHASHLPSWPSELLEGFVRSFAHALSAQHGIAAGARSEGM
jgi:hypothetical protein